MPEFAPLFADMEDLIKLGLFVLFFVLPALGKLFQEASKKADRPKRVPPPRGGDPNDVHADVAPGKAKGAGREALETEIEDFLRRASGRVEKPKPDARQTVEAPAPAAKPTPRRLAPGQASPTQQQAARRPASPGRRKPSGQPPRTRPLEEFEQLAQDLGQADERVESHLHDVFDHDLGQLTKTATDREGDEVILEGTDAATWESTADRHRRRSAAIRDRSARVIEMLCDPDNVRDAIIIGEILNPPKTLR